MKRAMLLAWVGVLGWCGLATGADKPSGKPQATTQDSIELAVESALQLPPGVQLTPAQETAIQKLRDHYRPLLRDAETKVANAKSSKLKRVAEDNLTQLKQRIAMEGSGVLSNATAEGSGGPRNDNGGSSGNPVPRGYGGVWYPYSPRIRIDVHMPPAKQPTKPATSTPPRPAATARPMPVANGPANKQSGR